MIPMIRRMSLGEATAAAALLAAIVIATASSCALQLPTGARPLTLKEQVFQSGGVLLGALQELEFAIQNGTIKRESETAKKLVQTGEKAFAVYRRASAFAIANQQADAAQRHKELLNLIDQLRRDLTAALVKP